MFNLVESPEYIEVKTDSSSKIIESITSDGTKNINMPVNINDSLYVNDYLCVDGSVYVEGPIDSSSFSIKEIDNPEYVKVLLDESNKILCGIKKDGSFYASNIEIIQKNINLFNDIFNVVDDPAGIIEMTTDSSLHIISYRRSDGVLVENTGIDTPNISIDGNVIETTNDPENRFEIKTDNEGKIISYRKDDGTLVENVGIETSEINLPQEGIDKLSSEINTNLLKNVNLYKSPDLPKYGTTNIKTETFFLTAVSGFNSILQTTIIQDFEDNADNAWSRMSISHYYFGNIRLRHYAYKKVEFDEENNKYYANETIRKVDGVWYYADTLGYDSGQTIRTKIIDGYTEIYSGSDIPTSGNYGMVKTEVIKCTGPVNVNTWTIEDYDYRAVNGTDIGKKYEHWCVCDIDFGHYLTKENAYVGVKHQGNSTLRWRKRNFRYTLYQESDYDKKDKVKIGEMLRMSKFNLKASWVDPTRVKELILYRIIDSIWKNRPITDRYDWDNEINGFYHGASGNIHGFPISLSVNDDFYGIYFFDLPKDGSNYMIDDKDEDTGLFVGGSFNTYNDWGVLLPYVIDDHYDSEMDKDDIGENYPAIEDALIKWTHFINNRLYQDTNNNLYGGNDMVFYVKRKVGGTNDEPVYKTTGYLLDEVEVKKGKIYIKGGDEAKVTSVCVASTLVSDENSVTAARPQGEPYAYRGTDNNLYIYSELTNINSTLYVTSTLDDGVPTEDSVVALSTGQHLYVYNIDNVDYRCLSYDTQVINGTRYVSKSLVTDSSSNSVNLIPFDKDHIPERLDVLGFIDYFILMQMFVMYDNNHNNILLYSGPDKIKMFPFIYDIDSSMQENRKGGAECDIFEPGVSLSHDLSLFKNFVNIYWDNIVNRYCELRKTYLSMDYIKSVYKDMVDNIPEDDFLKETNKWGTVVTRNSFDSKISFLETRLRWLDEVYFNI